MNIRFSKLVGIGGRALGSREDTEDAESSGPPSSLPSRQAPTSGVVTGAFGDAFTAPTIRPPPPAPEPRLPSSSPSGNPSAADGGSAGGAGFTSVIRHLSLRGWLQWVHANRSDATLRIRTWEGGSGRIWCSAGKIIDAEWDGRVGEEALRDLLMLSSGAVTIDFDPVEHPCRVISPTPELLHVGEELSVRALAKPFEAALAPPSVSARGERTQPSPLLPGGSAPPPASSTSARPKLAFRRWRGDYFAGVLVLAALAVAAFAFGRLSSELAQSTAREQTFTRQTKSGLHPPPAAPKAEPEAPIVTPKPRELPLIAFVPLEVEPANAEIWLDGDLVGKGRVQLGAIHDGMLHELRFVAAEHETKSLFFRDAPPAGRVVLKHMGGNEVAAASAAPGRNERPLSRAEPAGGDDATGSADEANVDGDAPKKLARRRPAAPAPAPVRTGAAADDPVPAEKPAAAKRPPQVQLIEVQTPRVQVLD
jgi:hypothetical protein